MQISFDEELSTLKEKILLMGSKVEESIRLALKAIVDRDSRLAKKVIQSDRDINDIEIEIDEICHRLLALHQPMAGDMRFITSAMKINSDLERQGDLAVNMAERALTLNEVAPLKPFIDIPRLAGITQEMVKVSLDSLVNRDPKLARAVCERDDEVDNLNDQIIRELISYMLEDRANIKRALDLILVSRYLERIADHATNVAEDVIYMVEGKDIRHSRG
ncbi:MAG TPA: phosphate signaling complex protein PhoU [bacterium]|jgi:phosphate transport system protein|nr:phosphate signaling complex protein PhoU [bacterium]